MLLAIETSSRVSSIALLQGDSLLGQRTFSHGLQNAARVLPLIDELISEAGAKPRSISQIAVSIGPGSFTGLRIGVTLAKTLAFATSARLLAVPTLPVIAANAPDSSIYVMPILDAKRDQAFTALYHRQQNRLIEVQPPQLVHLPDLLPRLPRPILALGEGIPHHRHHLTSPDITLAPEDLWHPTALTVAQHARQLASADQFSDPFTLAPLYIRKPEAQERMESGQLKHLEQGS